MRQRTEITVVMSNTFLVWMVHFPQDASLAYIITVLSCYLQLFGEKEVNELFRLKNWPWPCLCTWVILFWSVGIFEAWSVGQKLNKNQRQWHHFQTLLKFRFEISFTKLYFLSKYRNLIFWLFDNWLVWWR